MCAVVLSEPTSQILLLGGLERNGTTSPFYAYSASASDVLENREPGWKKMKGLWSKWKYIVKAGSTCAGLVPRALIE